MVAPLPLKKGDKCKVVKHGSSNWGSVVTVVDPNWNNIDFRPSTTIMVKVKVAKAGIRSYTRDELQLLKNNEVEEQEHRIDSKQTVNKAGWLQKKSSLLGIFEKKYFRWL